MVSLYVLDMMMAANVSPIVTKYKYGDCEFDSESRAPGCGWCFDHYRDERPWSKPKLNCRGATWDNIVMRVCNHTHLP